MTTKAGKIKQQIRKLDRIVNLQLTEETVSALRFIAEESKACNIQVAASAVAEACDKADANGTYMVSVQVGKLIILNMVIRQFLDKEDVRDIESPGKPSLLIELLRKVNTEIREEAEKVLTK